MHYIYLTKNFKQKIEDSIGNETIVSKAIETVKKTVDKLSTKQKLGALAGAALAATIGVHQFTKPSEISIESTTVQIQKEINKVAAELAKTKDISQREEIQNRIDELAGLRADRTEIVEASGESEKRLRNLIAVYRQTNLPVEKFTETTSKNNEKYTKRSFYKEITNQAGEKVPVYISEGHKELIRDVLDLIKNKKITFPDGYSTKKQKELGTYGVDSEEARHIKFIEDGKVPPQALFTMKELSKKFTSFQVASIHRSFSKGDFKGKISMHPLAALDVISVTFIGAEGKPITITAGDASTKSKNSAAIYVSDQMAEIVQKTGTAYQIITSDNVQESLKDKEGFSTKVNDPKSGKTYIHARSDHEDHWHWSFNYRDSSFVLAMTQQELADYSAKVKKGNSKNYNRLVDFLATNNVPSIFDKPGDEKNRPNRVETVTPTESTQMSKKINRTTKAFEKYMNNGSDLSYPGFIEEVEAMSARLKMDPNVLLSVFAFESGIRHDAKNPTSTASGLIQLMDFTAKEYGITTSELRKMNPLEQLKIVERYYTRWAKISGVENVYSIPENVYAAVAAPASLKYPLNRPVYKKGTENYSANPAWDADKDGVITKGEFLKAIMSNKSSKGFLPNNRDVGMQAPEIGN
jgi:Transglycosylase SLT domain